MESMLQQLEELTKYGNQQRKQIDELVESRRKERDRIHAMHSTLLDFISSQVERRESLKARIDDLKDNCNRAFKNLAEKTGADIEEL